MASKEHEVNKDWVKARIGEILAKVAPDEWRQTDVVEGVRAILATRFGDRISIHVSGSGDQVYYSVSGPNISTSVDVRHYAEKGIRRGGRPSRSGRSGQQGEARREVRGEKVIAEGRRGAMEHPSYRDEILSNEGEDILLGLQAAFMEIERFPDAERYMPVFLEWAKQRKLRGSAVWDAFKNRKKTEDPKMGEGEEYNFVRFFIDIVRGAKDRKMAIGKNLGIKSGLEKAERLLDWEAVAQFCAWARHKGLNDVELWQYYRSHREYEGNDFADFVRITLKREGELKKARAREAAEGLLKDIPPTEWSKPETLTSLKSAIELACGEPVSIQINQVDPGNERYLYFIIRGDGFNFSIEAKNFTPK